MLLDVLDDVFLLDLPLEATERALDRLALLNLDFSHACNTPSSACWLLLELTFRSRRSQGTPLRRSGRYCENR
jgi:hypothetical protein